MHHLLSRVPQRHTRAHTHACVTHTRARAAPAQKRGQGRRGSAAVHRADCREIPDGTEVEELQWYATLIS